MTNGSMTSTDRALSACSSILCVLITIAFGFQGVQSTYQGLSLGASSRSLALNRLDKGPCK